MTKAEIYHVTVKFIIQNNLSGKIMANIKLLKAESGIKTSKDFLLELKKLIDQGRTNSMFSWIFIWSDTYEGILFWCDMNNKLDEVLINYKKRKNNG